MTPWNQIETVATADGALQLRQRGPREFMIAIAGRVLMTSQDHRSEESLATLACKEVTSPRPRVLIGGLGMGYTVRAALDTLPANAEIVVVERTPAVAAWCRGPLAVLTDSAVLDRRVTVVIGDVARVIADARPGHYDAIILDLYEGPHAATQDSRDPFYSGAALMRSRAALVTGGVFAVWSEDPDSAFRKRFGNVGFDVVYHKLGKSRRHIVYVGKKLAQLPEPQRPSGGRPGGRPGSGPGARGGRLGERPPAGSVAGRVRSRPGASAGGTSWGRPGGASGGRPGGASRPDSAGRPGNARGGRPGSGRPSGGAHRPGSGQSKRGGR